MSQEFEYDVFISHSSKDKPAILKLAERLRDDGLKVWLDEWVIQPGDMIGLKIEEGLQNSRALLLGMSANAFDSDWVTLERHTALFRDPTNQGRRFIPLYLDNAEIPDILAQYAYIDWRTELTKAKLDDAYIRLLEALKPSLSQVQDSDRSDLIPSTEDEGSRTDSALEEFKSARCELLSMSHNPDSVRSMTFSGDGKRVLFGSEDGALMVWNMDRGRCLSILEGHTASILSVALSGDGKRALSGSEDGTLMVWDVERGECLSTLERHTESISVALSRDGERALSGSRDGTLRVWDVNRGECLSTLRGHAEAILSIALSKDGKRVLSGSRDGTLRVWDVNRGECLSILEGRNGSIYSVALSSDGKRALSGSENQAMVWDVDKGKCIRILPNERSSCVAVALSEDGKRALWSEDGVLRVWDLERDKYLRSLKGHIGTIYSVLLSADGNQVQSGSEDGTLRLWNVDRGKCRISTLEGHNDYVISVVLSEDGKRALSGSYDQTVRVWDMKSGRCVSTLEGHTHEVNSVALSSDGKRALSGSNDRTLRVWDLESGECLRILEGHTAPVSSIALSQNGKRVLSGSSDHTARVWDVESGECLRILEGHAYYFSSIALNMDGKLALSGGRDETLRVWDVESGECLRILEGHTAPVSSIALSPDGKQALSGSYDCTLKVWDVESGECLSTLEGHTEPVYSVALSGDGKRALSGSYNGTLRVWDVESGECLSTLEGHTDTVYSVALSEDRQLDSMTKPIPFAYSAARNGVLRKWFVEDASLFAGGDRTETVRYINAKILLVGDSGVGKTGLAIRLTENRFEETISTDGHWTTQLKVRDEEGWATQSKLPHGFSTDEIDREIWLWDFAGQQDYRLTHRLFVNESDVAVLVFNPQSDNPFEGLGQWNRELIQAASGKLKKLLVAGRCDRGGITVSEDTIQEFTKNQNFSCFLKTSALTGEGCNQLRESIVNSIDWDAMGTTSSPRIFKLLKDEILKLRDEGVALLRMSELKQRLEMKLPQERFTTDILRTVVRLLGRPGIVWALDFGDFVLLKPEYLNAYASAAIRKVRADEYSCISEEDVLEGRLDYQDMERLPKEEEEFVLRAMHETFIKRGLCLRQPTDTGNKLVFPTYLNRELPDDPGHPPLLVTYTFKGQLEEVYATLVVRLYHTKAFENDKLWRFAADYKTATGLRMGFKATRRQEGAAQIGIYFDPKIPIDTKVTFIKYVHEHLLEKAQGVNRQRHYVCSNCNTPVLNYKTVQKRLDKGLKDIICVDCEERVPLWDVIEEKFASEEYRQRVRELEERAKALIDNESKELILVGHAFSIAGEAGQIFRATPNSDWGIDGEIEFKDWDGNASGKRVYLQLKSGDSYLYERKDGSEVFTIKNKLLREYWQQQNYPVMLVIRTSNGEIRWMDVSAYLKDERGERGRNQVIFKGEPFTALNVQRMRDRFIPLEN